MYTLVGLLGERVTLGCGLYMDVVYNGLFMDIKGTK
jgi:hypothetical protein